MSSGAGETLASLTQPPGARAEGPWYRDWQDERHAERFDFRHHLDDRNLRRAYEAFNDVRLLTQWLDARRRPARQVTLLEVGCATGEFSRYLRIRDPGIAYYGIDISASAIARAREKDASARFGLVDPTMSLTEAMRTLGLTQRPEIVYSKDVVHHQTDPWGFISQLLGGASELLVMRLRTRDVGETVLDPERSCQYHYDGWMPYIVLNLQQMIDHILGQAPRCELRVLRHHMVLGGREGRFLPKECYLRATGTAETAVAVIRDGTRPGRAAVADHRDMNPIFTLDHRLRTLWSRVRRRQGA